MARAEEQLLARHVRRVDQRIAALEDRVLDEAAQLELHHGALGMPQDEPGPDLLLDREEVELLAEDPVVAPPRFLEPSQVRLEVVFSEPGRAVDALEHLAPLVAPPIGARAVQQLEMLDAPRARHMWSATQVHERAVGV